jgi:hypothetical protein
VSAFAGMSWDTFDENRQEIEAAVRLLLRDSKRRSLFKVVEVYETSTNELLAEVLSINFGPVVVYSTQVGVMANWKERAPGEGVPLHLRRQRGPRQITPLTGGSNQVFWVMSRSDNQYRLSGSDFVRVIADGGRPEHPNLTFKRVARRA